MPPRPSKAAVDAACAEVIDFIRKRKLLLHCDRRPEYPSTYTDGPADFRDRAEAFLQAVNEWESGARSSAPQGYFEVGMALAAMYCFFALASATKFKSPLLNFWTFTRHIESVKDDEAVDRALAVWDHVHLSLSVLFNAADTAVERVAQGSYTPSSQQQKQRLKNALRVIMEFVDSVLLS